MAPCAALFAKRLTRLLALPLRQPILPLFSFLLLTCSLAACERIFPEYSKGKNIPTDTVAAAPPPRNLRSSVLIEAHPDTIGPVQLDTLLRSALREQAEYLRRPDVAKFPVKGVSKEELLTTLELLDSCESLDTTTLKSKFDFYRVNTALQSDQVRFTGYYTPVIPASRTRGGGFIHPIYKQPKFKVTAAAVRSGALAGKGLELAWLRSKKEVANAQLQGSCMVRFPDGEQQYFGFGGTARGGGKPYVFFTEVDDIVLGAGTFPLTPGYSIAVDLRYIPLGATLLAELPDLDPAGKVKGYSYRVVFAQDRGGGILSTKRVDVYCGMGQEALAAAHRINGLGRMWLLLPKRS